MSDNTTAEVQSITITEKAAAEILTIRAENSIPDNYALRVGVKGGGCSGFTCSLGFDGEVQESDDIMEINGVKLVVDSKSLFYMAGTVVDYNDSEQGRGFVFNNPNAANTCSCGSAT